VGLRASVLCIVLAFVASACAFNTNPGTPSSADSPAIAAEPTTAASDHGQVPAGASATSSASGSSGSVTSTVSVNSTSVSSSSSASASGSQTVVHVSVTTRSGSVDRTVSYDGAGDLRVRVTAKDDEAPVIDVELAP
jgi:hypothetical protein